jgi:hypothetical protein
LVAHVCKQVPPEHTYGAHETGLALSMQAPEPSQTLPTTLVLFALHVAAPQLLPAFAKVRQTPPVSQSPSAPHAVPDAVHALFGSVSTFTGPQLPEAEPSAFLMARHDWHGPLQAPSQQTPSTQNTDWHCEPTVQAAPFACGTTHAPPLQVVPEAQSLPVVQDVAQAEPLHKYG